MSAGGIAVRGAQRRARVRPAGSSLMAAMPAWFPLAAVLSMQAAVALTTLHNTAFQDEALYLYAGRQIVGWWLGGPAPVEHYAYYFSGYPGAYPVVGGALDMIGGLELARAFSLFCMLGVTSLAYLCSLRLFGRTPAIFAGAVYALVGSVLYLSRLATFDGMCLLLIALATAAAVHAGDGRRRWLALSLGPLLVLAIVTKYAAMLFFPSVIALQVLSARAFAGWRQALPQMAVAVLSLAVSAVLALVLMDGLAFHAIGGSTTARVLGMQAPRLEMLKHLLYMAGFVYALGLAGLFLTVTRQPRLRLIAIVLFGSSLLMPAYHIYKQEPISFDKHIAYALFFVMPLAGYAVAWLAGALRPSAEGAPIYHGLAGVAAVMIVFVLGLQQSQWLYAGWADTASLSTVLHTQMRDGSGRYLVEDIEVARYDAKDVTEAWQWNGPYYFSYVNRTHQQLYGNQALTQEINDGYYALVELSFIYQPNTAFFIAERLAESRNYDLLAVIPFRNSYGTGHYFIWRLALASGHGKFTSLAQIGL